MAKVILSGTGSTKRARRVYSPSDPADERQLLSELKAWADAGDPFMGRLADIEAGCKRILDGASLEHDTMALLAGPAHQEQADDSPAGYALRALNRLRLLRQALDAGEARMAADLAFDLGALLAEASMKPEADRAFRSAIGRKAAAKTGDTYCKARDAEVVKLYTAAIANGLPRKAVLADLTKKFSIGDRQLRQIVPPARQK